MADLGQPEYKKYLFIYLFYKVNIYIRIYIHFINLYKRNIYTIK
jgi:hypothetical protein